MATEARSCVAFDLRCVAVLTSLTLSSWVSHVVLNLICSLPARFIRNRFLCRQLTEDIATPVRKCDVLLLDVLTRDNDERFCANLRTVNSRQTRPPWTTHDAFEAGLDSMPNVRAALRLCVWQIDTSARVFYVNTNDFQPNSSSMKCESHEIQWSSSENKCFRPSTDSREVFSFASVLYFVFFKY